MGRRARNPIQIVAPVSSKRQLLNKEAVRAFLGGISDTTLDNLRRDPDARFPKPLDIFGQSPVWSVDQLERYVERKQKQAEAVTA